MAIGRRSAEAAKKPRPVSASTTRRWTNRGVLGRGSGVSATQGDTNARKTRFLFCPGYDVEPLRGKEPHNPPRTAQHPNARVSMHRNSPRPRVGFVFEK